MPGFVGNQLCFCRQTASLVTAAAVERPFVGIGLVELSEVAVSSLPCAVLAVGRAFEQS